MKASEQIILNYFDKYLFSNSRSKIKYYIRSIIQDYIARTIAMALFKPDLELSYIKIVQGSSPHILKTFLEMLSKQEEKNVNRLIKDNGLQGVKHNFISNCLKKRFVVLRFPVKQLVWRQTQNVNWLQNCRINKKILTVINDCVSHDSALLHRNKRILFIIRFFIETDIQLKYLSPHLKNFLLTPLPANIPDAIPIQDFPFDHYPYCDIIPSRHLDDKLLQLCTNLNQSAQKTRMGHGFFRKMQKPYQNDYPPHRKKFLPCLKDHRRKYQIYYEYNALLIAALQLLEIILRDMANYHNVDQKDITFIYKKLHRQNNISEECANLLEEILSPQKLNLRNKVQHGALILHEVHRMELVVDYQNFKKKTHNLENYYYAVITCINNLLNFYPSNFNRRTWHCNFLLTPDEITFLEGLCDYFFVKNKLHSNQKQMSNFINKIIKCSTLAKLPCCAVRNKNKFYDTLLFTFFPPIFEQIYRNMCLRYLRCPIVDPPSSKCPMKFRYSLLDKKHLANNSNVFRLFNRISPQYDFNAEYQRFHLLIKVRDAFAHGALFFQYNAPLHMTLHKVFVNQFFIFSEIDKNWFPIEQISDLNLIYEN